MKDFLPSASIQTIQQRAVILARIRGFFDKRGFFEVQTPALSRDTVVDRYIEPLEVKVSLGGKLRGFWLQTSPEFAMKRLLAAGARAIYQIGPAFRAAEVGDSHNVEFTMLEWYRVGDSYRQGMDLLDEFAQEILGCPPAERLTYREAFQRFCQVDPFGADPEPGHDELNLVLADHVEPQLKLLDSVILYDWPADQAALARVRNESELAFAERFELYVRGVELANGYNELTDAAELLARNEAINADRVASGRAALPVDSRLLDAMRYGLPDCCGVALGVDRLVMLALGKSSIQEVMPFDIGRA